MTLVTFLICDDIRNEIGNKYSIIGVYDDTINFAVPISEKGKWPKAIKLGVFIKIKFDSEAEKEKMKKYSLETIFNSNKKILAEGVIDISNKKETKGLNIAIVLGQFIFEGIGTLKIRLTLKDENNNDIQSFESQDALRINETIL
jgi:hypothetical protein